MSDQRTVWLMRVDPDHKSVELLTIYGIQEVGKILGDEQLATTSGANEMLERFVHSEGAIPLAATSDPQKAAEAAEGLERASQGVCTAGVDPTEDEIASCVVVMTTVGDEEADAEEWIERVVARTALAVLAIANGNPTAAIIYANTLAFATGDETELYEAVAAHIESSFGRAE